MDEVKEECKSQSIPSCIITSIQSIMQLFNFGVHVVSLVERTQIKHQRDVWLKRSQVKSIPTDQTASVHGSGAPGQSGQLLYRSMVDTKEFITPELLESINEVAEVSGFTEFNDALKVIKADLNQAGVDWSSPSSSQSGWQNLFKGIKDMLTMQSILAEHAKKFDTTQLIANCHHVISHISHRLKMLSL